MHAVGTSAWVRHLTKRYGRSDGPWESASVYWVMISTAVWCWGTGRKSLF